MKNSNKLISDAFTLLESVITITVISLLLSVISFGVFNYFKLVQRVNTQVVETKRTSEALKIISLDRLNVNRFPRFRYNDYVFQSDKFVFFTGGEQVEYKKANDGLLIVRDEVETLFKGISNVNFDYYDRFDRRMVNDNFPEYCVMEFKAFGKEMSLRIRI